MTIPADSVFMVLFSKKRESQSINFEVVFLAVFSSNVEFDILTSAPSPPSWYIVPPVSALLFLNMVLSSVKPVQSL